MTTLALPTRRDERFRYTDVEALVGLWPVEREEIAIAAGETGSLEIIVPETGAFARHLVITVGEGATFDVRILNAGVAFGRVEIDVILEANADFTLGAAQLASGTETVEIVSEVKHTGLNATSKQIIRSVLAGQSTATYLGRIAVTRGADGTDAAQSVRAMLLDRTATANARPELEIYADDVKAAHGCAIGELDAQGLFYLMSRGLPPADAKRLMLQAFIAEAFTGAPNEEALSEQALARLGAIL